MPRKARLSQRMPPFIRVPHQLGGVQPGFTRVTPGDRDVTPGERFDIRTRIVDRPGFAKPAKRRRRKGI